MNVVVTRQTLLASSTRLDIISSYSSLSRRSSSSGQTKFSTQRTKNTLTQGAINAVDTRFKRKRSGNGETNEKLKQLAVREE